ncbi:(Fe-S)-binding protein [Actibacterium sp. XHP0104]|uniref:(Fe-S)-binding protein n=1 Tax=Actibacterium sp. XHP0104 TaxID=2984335 RepID=UPI0021E936D0|nr:(Fe-S)-binding protein [Actibacterium sp. XHP0104]MCV2880400.1 (Fe-S)-binding protein [Actibacterium sp. XHP0104]
MQHRSTPPRVGFFVTCIVDAMRPNIGFASLKLLEAAGCDVEVPQAQTCCGQPAFNSGDDATTRDLARQVIEVFEGYDYVVAPSGSCASMIRSHYGELFADDPAWAERQRALSAKTWEILSFLRDVMDYHPQGASYDGVATYHDSCSGLRDLGVHDQPRALLGDVAGLRMVPLQGNDECCGFGGTFCVKYPSVSNAIVEDKAAKIEATGADTLLGGDMGCLMNMAGKLSRRGSDVKVYHTVEVLAGMADGPAICKPEKMR